MLRKIKRILSSISIPSLIVYILGIISCCVLSSNTADGRLDGIAYQLHNYNEASLREDENTASIMTVQTEGALATKEGKESYKSLYNEYYYNRMVYGIRMVVDNKTAISFSDNTFFDLKLLCQPTFSIQGEVVEGEGFYLDYGYYYTYFPKTFLGSDYNARRFDTLGFLFVSDTLADKLLDYYNIDSYEQLILNEEYAVLTVYFDDVAARLVINNIVHTNNRKGPRTYSLYNDFALTDLGWTEYAKVATMNTFEIDLKPNSYCLRKAMKSIKNSGFMKSTSTFTIRTLDAKTNQYITNEKMALDIYNIMTFKFDTALYIPYFVICLLISIYQPIIKMFKNKKKSIFVTFLTMIFISIIFFFVTSFIYSYYMYFTSIILSLTLYFIFNRKEIINDFSVFTKKYFKKSNELLEEYFSLEI